MNGIKSFSQLEPNHLIDDLRNFIEGELANFIRSDEFVQTLSKKKNENQHSLSFCLYMTNKCSARFYFARENAQTGSSVIDIGVYKGSVLIFTIEAKLLPIPRGTIGNPRNEHEYVYGKGAGIQRFKEEKHGVDNCGNLLFQNGMIGFLKEEDAAFWLTKINKWIDDAGWPVAERIIEVVTDTGTRFVSKHLRTSKKELILHHFWIAV
jgi:hypothetical protein